jgi:hypothetical protein
MMIPKAVIPVIQGNSSGISIEDLYDLWGKIQILD